MKEIAVVNVIVKVKAASLAVKANVKDKYTRIRYPPYGGQHIFLAISDIKEQNKNATKGKAEAGGKENFVS